MAKDEEEELEDFDPDKTPLNVAQFLAYMDKKDAEKGNVKQMAERFASIEDNFIVVPDKVAVLHIGTIKIETIDGIPGYYQMTAGEYASYLQEKGVWSDEIAEGFFETKEGLSKYYRFKTVIDEVPTDEDLLNWEIMSTDNVKGERLTGMMMSEESNIAMRMRRIGGDEM